MDVSSLSLHRCAAQQARAVRRRCRGLVMVGAGEAELVSTVSGESGALCTFKTTAGDVFTLPRPPISKELEAEMLRDLRDILDEEGV